MKLIQASLSAQQIRCRPIELKEERQTVLLVAPEHEVEAMELVSRIGVAVADNEMATRSEEAAEALKQRDMTVVRRKIQRNRRIRVIRQKSFLPNARGLAASSIRQDTDTNSVSGLNLMSPSPRATGKSSQTSARNVKSL